VSVIAGGVWLIYSLVEVTTWVSRSNEIRQREAGVEEREAEAKRQIAETNARRAEAEARAQAAQEQETAAKKRTDDIQQRLIAVRDEIGGLGTLLTELSSARAKASKLMASEAVETQLADMRGALGKTLGRIEQQIDTALPPAENKARIYLFIADEQFRDAASALKKELESSGFDVGSISKNTTRRLDPTEVRYFQEPRDKTEAGRIVAILEKLGYAGSRSVFSSDPDHASGSKKFQVWLGKPAGSGLQRRL
jgi:aromatic ring-cleaving dioxygenase